jgi:HKD family nuclease
MKIGTIENNAHNTLEGFLRATAKDASALDWASAFVTNAGLNAVLYLLTAAAKKGKVRVLTGFYQVFTEPSALRTLLKAQTESRGHLEVRVSEDQHFHWKAYFVFGKRTVRVVVGSSNLTSNGLAASGEFNVTLSMQKESLELKQVHGLFDKHWRHGAVPLTKTIVDEYSRRYKKLGTLPNRQIPLKAILGKQQPIPTKPIEARYFRCSIKGHYDEATHDLLSKATNWDKKGFGSFSDAKAYRAGDRVILFDFLDDRIKVVQITDTTRTPVRTPDGVHFAAYKRVPRISLRKWCPSRRASLKIAGLIKGTADAETQTKLNEQQYRAFVDNLKKTV